MGNTPTRSNRPRRNTDNDHNTTDDAANDPDPSIAANDESSSPNRDHQLQDNDEGRTSGRTSSKRRRRPPLKFVARPSVQGVGCHEGDLAFLNDEAGTCTNYTTSNGNIGNRVGSDVKRGRDGGGDRLKSSRAKKFKSSTTTAGGNNGNTASGKKKRDKSTVGGGGSGSGGDVIAEVSVRTSARSRRYVMNYTMLFDSV